MVQIFALIAYDGAMNAHKGYLLAIFASFAASFYFIPYKEGLKSIEMGQFVFAMFIASIVLNGIPLAIQRKKIQINRATVITAIVFAVLSYCGNYFNGLSLQQVTPAITSVILRTQVIMIVFMGWFFLKEKISLQVIAGATVALIGINVLGLAGGDLQVHKMTGIFWAFMAALSFAIIQIVTKRNIDKIHPISLNIIRLVLATVLSGILCKNPLQVLDFGIREWTLCTLAALSGTTLSRVASIYSLKYIPVSRATIISTLTPVFTLLLGWIFLRDLPLPRELFGGAIIMIGIWIPVGAKLIRSQKARV